MTGDAPPALWRATVPVFLSALDRISQILDKTEALPDPAAALALPPADGMLPAGQQIATAVQFMLRIAFPLAGRRVPEPRAGLDIAGLRARVRETRMLLGSLSPREFEGAEARPIRAQAGFAEIDLPGEAFLHRFGLPNLHFHQAMAHAALKRAGVPLGKADFDGLHDYPEGFSFG